ncbi:MAG: MBL fold metallo-hydrolase [Oscillospiraceae bacterium]|jgi:phosphoribosyl 1,2-cyclic phosphodiesterase|nr:MBL fold metallo-hydrolase [Oscillospiraceae bacterium]
MKFMTFASGSGGNSALVWNAGTRILVDAGISATRITAALAAVGAVPAALDAVLVTHGHTDHTAGLPILLKRTSAQVWTSGGTASEICPKCPEDRVRVIAPGSALRFGTMTVRSFETPHDSAGSTGFVISEDGGASLAFVTDLGRVTAEVRRAALGVSAAILESNHDLDMLRAGPYPWPLKRRVGGDFGHLSNEAAGQFARELAEAGAKCLLLAHLSETNNTPETARRAVAAALGDAAGSVTLSVAPAGECSEIFEI